MPTLLITGGARSGKSAHAEARTCAFAGQPVYIATAEAWDDEMRARIALHRDRRGPEWAMTEAPLDLVGALDASDGAGPRLVDCLTMWLANLMGAERDWQTEADALIKALARQSAPVVLVTNEVGLGIVPDNALARAFRDAQGSLNRQIAAMADEVSLIVAGLPLHLKGPI